MVLLAACTVSARAQTNWTGTISSDWFTAGNWSAGVPTSATSADISTATPNAAVIAAPGAIAQRADVGVLGPGILTIESGGTLSDSMAAVGGKVGAGQGLVTVTGLGSKWTNTSSLQVGGNSTGTLTIAGGATVTSVGGAIGLGGAGFGSRGNVVVTGQGSSWLSSPGVEVGTLGGTGTLTVGDGGTVSGPIFVASTADSIGTVNIGAGASSPAVAPGTLNTTSVTFGAGAGTLNFNHTSSNYVFAPAISGPGTVNVLSGTTILTAPNTYSGPTNVIGGVLQAGAVNTFSPNSTLRVANGGTLDLNGFNQTVLNLTNAGLVNMGTGTAPGTILTTNNYTGNGGTIALNTFLGADGSPSDKLVINGGTADPALVRITNAGGPGALTTANGILVVQAINGGTTAPGAFTLAGELRAGAFDYDLFRGGLGGVDPQNWFLRSTFIVEPGGPQVPIGSTPPPEPLPPGVFPIIGPEDATYGMVQPIARQMGLTTLGTLHERVGDAAADAACMNADATGSAATLDSAAITKAPPVPYGNCQQAVWGRVFGQQIDNHYEAFADPRASGQVAGIQSGADIWRGSLIPGHSDTAGVYFAYGNGNVSVDGLVTNAATTAYVLQHTGGVNLNAFSVGGYWTHHGPTGGYIDAVLQGSFYNGNAATQFANLPISGTGFISSLEGGYPIPLLGLGPGFVLEPEAQIIWQQVSFDDANDGLGPVGLGTTSGTSGRLGLRAKWTIPDAAGRVWQPYVLANIWRDWGADATTLFGPDPVPLLEQATRLEFAGGLSAKILPGLSLYAQAGYQFAVSGTDGGTRDGVRGDLGVRYTW